MTALDLLLVAFALGALTSVLAALTATHHYRRGRHAAHLAHRLDTLPREDRP